MAMVQTNTEQLQNQLANSELTLDAVVSKTCQIMKNAAFANSSAKLLYLLVFPYLSKFCILISLFADLISVVHALNFGFAL
jgi:hypothetical protein